MNYEYKVISGSSNVHWWDDVDAKLNALTGQGWEIFQTVGATKGGFGFGTGGVTAVIIFVLRRQKG